MKGLETSAAQRRIDQQCQQPRLGEIAVTMTKEEFTATDMACAQGEAFRAGVTMADKLERELAALKAQAAPVGERADLDSSVIEEVIEHMDRVWSGEADEDVTVELTRRLRDFARAALAQSERVPASVGADDVRGACQDAIEVFSEQPDADQCREVAEYMREVLLAIIARREQAAGPAPKQEAAR